ncbi:DNA-binding transcriptional MerR regulator [Stackebrandtia endophytica]|uniref:DNA-binding transcriptional MerR regulator n=1 Tax=Stackebrandtia endophytica TaxID=1496996 RepID=A0A543B1P4_9ACTN|nr:MerR family transcriptional regulator [Stackebrandtia endophytica]TQL78753.1 DNA-binding transcriptional MerR regulator [Stackebrandtia endophytica]
MTRALRPIDLADEHGLSSQAIRNYEAQGVLPPVTRSATGYRQYTPLHAQALRAFLAMRPGHGHQRSVAIMVAAHGDDTDNMFELIDTTHAELLAERGSLAEVTESLAELAGGEATRPMTTGELTVGELAHQLDLHPATLRKWEAAGVLHPQRNPATRYRVYSRSDVTDALIARQLRRGGYLLDQIAEFLVRLREAGDEASLTDLLRTWRTRLERRGEALLAGAAELHRYLRQRAV